MSYPELYSDERIVLQAQNVKVKSVSFEVILTTRRLVLIDAKRNSIPPQEINLATLKDVETGENAIRDPIITISIITISGNIRQMVLTFSKTSGGERRRECDDWVSALRQNITTTIYHPVSQDAPRPDQEPLPISQNVTPVPGRTEMINAPPQKKRIEIARPMKKIVESAPVMPVPVETTSLPTGSFCNRCGNRVPPESAFCNRCGTPVVQDMGSGHLPPEEVLIPPQQPAPSAPRVQVPPPPVSGTAMDRKDRPIEQVIHSIEPLIEDSVPRTAPSPLVPAKQVHYAPTPDLAVPGSQVPPATNADTPATTAPAEVQWPVLSSSEAAGVPLPPAAPPSPPSPGSPLPVPPRKISFTVVAVLILAVLAVIAGVYLFMQMQSGSSGITPTPSPTPVITAPAQTTPVPTVATTMVPATTPQQVITPSVVVPDTGVWVKVTYPNKFSGAIGTPGSLQDVADSGDHLYQISTVDGPVVVSIQKADGSSTELDVDVYKNGELIKHSQTTSPKGIIEIQALLKPATTATIAAPAANTTVKETDTPTTETTT